MDTPEKPGQEPSKRASIPLWAGFLLATFVWAVIPWALSLLTYHIGWKAGRPGPWNLLGLVAIVPGIAGLFWGMLQHSAQTPRRIDMEATKNYLLKDGMYRYSRNPMYLAELILMFGWVIFYGSLAVLAGFIAWWALFNFYQIPSEERILEASFGEAFRQYKNEVPRWIGLNRRKK